MNPPGSYFFNLHEFSGASSRLQGIIRMLSLENSLNISAVQISFHRYPQSANQGVFAKRGGRDHAV